MSDRTLPPSPGRLALARRAGLFVRSPLLNAGCVLVALLAGGDAIRQLALGVNAIAHEAWLRAGTVTDRDALASAMRSLLPRIDTLAAFAADAMLFVAAAAVVAAFAQTGPAWTLSTAHARRRLAMGPQAAQRGRRLAAIVCIPGAIVVAAWMLWTRRAGLADLAERHVADGAATVASSLIAAAWWLAGALLLAGAVELVASRLALRARLRMTPDEARREQAEQAGAAWRADANPAPDDPAAINAAAAILASRELVVVVRLDAAGEPRIVTAGTGPRAERLLALAADSGVPQANIDASTALGMLTAGAGEQVATPWRERVMEALGRA